MGLRTRQGVYNENGEVVSLEGLIMIFPSRKKEKTKSYI